MTTLFLYAIPIGAIAGLLAGLFGIGGGLILVSALIVLLPMLGVPEQHIMHVALATSLTAIVLTALSSARAHAARGSILWPTFRRLAPGLVLGGLAGAQLAGQIPDRGLRIGVAVFCVVAAIELWRPKPTGPVTNETGAPQSPWLLLAGTVIGVVSALVGIGGGSMTVPLLVRLGAKPVAAVGTSAACGLPIAGAAAAGFIWNVTPPSESLPSGIIGFVHWPLAVMLGFSSVLVAPLGARWAHRLPGTQLKRAFAMLLLLVAAQLFWRSFVR